MCTLGRIRLSRIYIRHLIWPRGGGGSDISTTGYKSRRRNMQVFMRQSNRPTADAAQQLLSRDISCGAVRCLQQL